MQRHKSWLDPNADTTQITNHPVVVEEMEALTIQLRLLLTHQPKIFVDRGLVVMTRNQAEIIAKALDRSVEAWDGLAGSLERAENKIRSLQQK